MLIILVAEDFPEMQALAGDPLREEEGLWITFR
jgi:hypothetical protein